MLSVSMDLSLNQRIVIIGKMIWLDCSAFLTQ